jgi:hypothetical protein
MKTLKVGDPVKYINPADPYKKEVKEGVVHGVRTKELPNGDGTTTIVDRTYLIDTGDDNPEAVAMQEFNESGELVSETRQPEQIEVRIK